MADVQDGVTQLLVQMVVTTAHGYQENQGHGQIAEDHCGTG